MPSYNHASEYAASLRQLREPKVSSADFNEHSSFATTRIQQSWTEERRQLRERIAELESTVCSKEETIDLYRSKVSGLTAQIRQRQDVEAEMCELQKAIAERDDAYRILERRARFAEQEKREQEQRYSGLHDDIEHQMQTIQGHYVKVVDNLEAQLKAMTHERDRVSELLWEARDNQQLMAARIAGNAPHVRPDSNQEISCSGSTVLRAIEATRSMHTSQQLMPSMVPSVGQVVQVLHTSSDQREARRGW